MADPPLRPLHSRSSLSQAKLEKLRRAETFALLASLRPGEPGALKAKPDGTLMDGHHRIAVLRERGVDVDVLPREVVGPSGEL